MPEGVGTWPAIWMLGQNISEPGAYWQNLGYGTTEWPFCGEIDVMEHWGAIKIMYKVQYILLPVMEAQ